MPKSERTKERTRAHVALRTLVVNLMSNGTFCITEQGEPIDENLTAEGVRVVMQNYWDANCGRYVGMKGIVR